MIVDLLLNLGHPEDYQFTDPAWAREDRAADVNAMYRDPDLHLYFDHTLYQQWLATGPRRQHYLATGGTR